MTVFAEGMTSSEHYDEEAINSALHRLAVRQQQRQYAANKGTVALPGGGAAHDSTESLTVRSQPDNVGHSGMMKGGPAYHLDSSVQHPAHRDKGGMSEAIITQMQVQEEKNQFEQLQQQARPHNTHYGSRALAAPVQSYKPSSNSHQQNANDTFNSFVEENVYDSELAAAYQQVTGTLPHSKEYTPTTASTQYALAQHQQQLKQQRMGEQSRAMLEHSKAKHQAMVAQAHAAATKHNHHHHHHGQPPTISFRTAGQQHHQPTSDNNHSNYQEDGEVVNGVSPTPNSNLLAPKPPPKPSSDRKPASAHRMARSD